MKRCSTTLFSLVSLLLAATAFGQTSTSQISGTVADASGALIPGAAVTLVNESTGVTLKSGYSLPEAKLQDKQGVIGPVFFQNAEAFTFPAPGDTGLGRNIFQGPSYWKLNASVSKGFQVNERVRVILRAEAFNALNHPNFRNPRDASVGTPTITSSLFGQACCVTLSTAGSATTNQNGESWRVLQLALKLSF